MMGRIRFRRALSFTVVLLLSCGGALLAQGAGEVGGQVKGAQGEPLSGVAVKLLRAGNETNQQQTSDAQGAFRFDHLASGVYIATASLDGYSPVTCPGVRIVASLTRRLEIKLMPADGEQPSTCEAVTNPG